MIYLPDVNTLIALALSQHEFHDRVATWIQREGFPVLVTCSITELGFVRVVAQMPRYGYDVGQARSLLLRLKKSGALSRDFIADDQDVTRLPSWVKTPKQTTDGHLLQLAKENSAILATLDAKIPSAYLIPAL